MNLINKLLASAVVAALPLAAVAQTTPLVESNNPTDWGPVAGDGELTFGGSGGSSTDFDDSFGGFNASLGTFLSNTLYFGLRQSVNYVNPDNGGSSWNGSTRLALDQHLGQGRLRPFVGINAGRIYGDAVRDTWAAGLEGGAKFYVRPKTFIVAQVEYSWFFERGRSVDDRFSDGQLFYGIGMGYNF